MSMTYCGPLKWASSTAELWSQICVQGHSHRQGHVTFAHSGWMLILTQDGSDRGKVVQIAHPDYVPDEIIPVRMKDKAGYFGPTLDIIFVNKGGSIPEGGEVIEFKPEADYAYIPAGVHHSIHTLSLFPKMRYLCVYPRGDKDDVSEVLD